MNTQKGWIYLLDKPIIEDNAIKIPIQLRYRKALGLLGFLAAERNRNHSRAFIASLFWPDLNEQSARVNLRQVLSILTKLFEGHQFSDALNVDRYHITFQNNPLLNLDIAHLETIQNCAMSEINNKQELIDTRLLTGEFMSGYSLPGCDEFEDWLADKRAFYRSCQTRLLNTLIMQAQADRQSSLVINYAQMIQQLNPDNESLLRDTMLLCAENGQSRMALRMFDNFTQRIQREMGVLPDIQSQLLYNRLNQELIEQPDRSPLPEQFPAIEKISPVVVVHLQWRCHLTDPEASAQTLFDADLYARKLLCSEMGAYKLTSAGRGAFFYFGWPLALEDNAWIAVRGAIRLMHYARNHADIDLRVGIHCGILFSSISDSLPDLLGDVTEESILLCQSATNGQILLSEPCYRLLNAKVKARKVTERRRRNDGSLLGTFLLVDEPIWFEESDLLPLAEQEPLSSKLDELCDQVKRLQSPLCVSLISPAGSGKTLMITQWLKKQRQYGDRVFKLRCYPDRRQQPLFPLISCIRQLLGFQADETVKADTLKERLLRHGWDKIADQPILIELLTNEVKPSEEMIQQISVVIMQMLQEVNNVYLLIWIEDAQWIDSATLTLIDKISDLTSCSLFLLVSARHLPEDTADIPWLTVNLPKLSDDSASRLLKFFSQKKQTWRSPDETAFLLKMTDGNPYLLKAMSGITADYSIPPEILHHFSYPIDQLAEWRDSALQLALQWPDIQSDKQPFISQTSNLFAPADTLNQLLAAKLLVSRSKKQISFTPPLLERVLASLNPPSRQRFVHKTLALKLQKKQQGKDAKDNKERLAYHWKAAGELHKAADLYLHCGQTKLQQRRYLEGTKCLGEAFKLGSSVEYSLKTRITLLNDLAQCRIMAFGYGDQQAYKAASEALQLARQVTDDNAYFRALYLLFLGIGSVDSERSRLQTANLLYDHAKTPAQLTLAHWALANSYFWLGQFKPSREHAEQSMLLNDQLDPTELYHYSHESPVVLSMCFLCWGWCFNGQPKQAVSYCDQLLALPAETLTAISHCFQLFFAASTLASYNEPVRALETAQACHQIANSLQHHLWLCASELLILSLTAAPNTPANSEQIDWLINGIHNAYADGLPMGVLMGALMGAQALINSGDSQAVKILLQRTLYTLADREHDLFLNILHQLYKSL